jgi:hypothetical protein
VTWVFISCKRKADRNRKLTHFLYDGLKAAGIEGRIDGWDFLMVLLSAAWVESEMVQGKVRLAHNRRRQNGRLRSAWEEDLALVIFTDANLLYARFFRGLR